MLHFRFIPEERLFDTMAQEIGAYSGKGGY